MKNIFCATWSGNSNFKENVDRFPTKCRDRMSRIIELGLEITGVICSIVCSAVSSIEKKEIERIKLIAILYIHPRIYIYIYIN